MSRSRLPSSKARLSQRVLVLDVACAAVAPILAYFIRDPDLLDQHESVSLLIYVGLSVVISAISLRTFRVAQGLPRFFSFHDVVEIAKASAASVATISAVLFSFTRLDDVPRSVPIIHFLVLASLLIAVRMVRRAFAERQEYGGVRAPTVEQEQAILLVGANRLAWFYARILDTFSLGHRRVIGILDENQKLVGRSIYGHFVLGTPDNAETLLDDFCSHGILVSTVVICELAEEKAAALRDRLTPLAQERGFQLEMLAKELGVEEGSATAPALALAAAPEPPPVKQDFVLSPYFRIRRVLDATLSGSAILLLLPVFAMVAASVYLVLDAPVIFWQRRVGRDGRPIYVYKFRSMRNPVDAAGRILSEEERASGFGSFLRATRLDELPQLFNVLRGDMAIIGPRPLLPVDQPACATVRLSVPPGITGWAQIHGGKLISVDEKNALDEFYVRHASVKLDAAIVFRTMSTVLRGDRRDAALAKALDEGEFDLGQDIDAPYPDSSRRIA